MNNNNTEYTFFQKTKGDKKVWCVYFKDEEGNRLNPIYVSKLKKMVYKGRTRNNPIPLTENGKDNLLENFQRFGRVFNYDDIKLRRDDKGITTMNIYDFLMDENSINA